MNRLWVRLTAAILVVTWAVLAVVAITVNRLVDASFQQYVGVRNFALFDARLVAQLESYYTANGTWSGAETLLPTMGRGMGERRGRGGPQTFVAGPDGTIAAATDPSWIGRSTDSIGAAQTVPLAAGGEVIGTLGQQSPAGEALGRAEQAFSTQVSRALLLLALAATLLALVLGLVLALGLSRPLQRLAEQIRHRKQTELGDPLPLEGPREVRELADSFNTLSQRLADGERLRRQLTSDVAHELRTPISVLRGHLEAMMDGVYPLDAEHLAVTYDQSLHLARLVEDLRLLTAAEGGRLPLQFVPIAPASLVEEAVARFAPLAQDAGVTLHGAAAPGLPPLQADAVRLRQVFDNLLTNALRHTAGGGAIRLTAAQHGSTLRFAVSNTGDLPPEHAAHLFDRFWRGDDARRADTGGSGLGLAITRQLVLLHHGTIAVTSAAGVTTFHIDLPMPLQS